MTGLFGVRQYCHVRRRGYLGPSSSQRPQCLPPKNARGRGGWRILAGWDNLTVRGTGVNNDYSILKRPEEEEKPPCYRS